MRATDQVSSSEPTTASVCEADADVTDDAERSDAVEWSTRAAWIAFAAYVVVAFFVLRYGFGAHLWFSGDEWGFLAGRSLGDVDDLFRPQNQHWSTGPIVVYQTLYTLFGLESYGPYQATVILLHLTLACLVRAVMRRAGVGPWIATCAAGTLVLFGPGEESILFGVQVSQTGSMVFGFTHLLLADHDGPPDRRDWLGLGAGALGLAFSGVGPAFVGVVGVAVLLRRGWRMAALHTLPLIALYGVWYLVYTPTIAGKSSLTSTLGAVWQFVATGVSNAVGALAGPSLVAVVLVAMTAIGLVLAVVDRPWDELRRRSSTVVALVAGLAALYGMVCLSGRAPLGPAGLDMGRYLYMGAAMALPVMAVAGDAIARRWRLLTPIVCAVFLVGVPANIGAFGEEFLDSSFYDKQKQLLTQIGNSPLARRVPAGLKPDRNLLGGSYATAGALVAASDAGKLPDLADDPRLEAPITLRLGIDAQDRPLPDVGCESKTRTAKLRPAVGDVIGIRTRVTVALLDAAGRPVPGSLSFSPAYGPYLEIMLPDLELSVTTSQPNETFLVCPRP